MYYKNIYRLLNCNLYNLKTSHVILLNNKRRRCAKFGLNDKLLYMKYDSEWLTGCQPTCLSDEYFIHLYC
jgi:hypothetical protein